MGLLFLLVFCNIHVLSIDSALALFPYYIAGHFASRLLKFAKNKNAMPLAMIGMIVYSTISIANGYIDYDQMKLGHNVLMTYASALIGCYSITLLFSGFFQYRNLLLADIGMNTLTILGFHSVFIQIFRFAYKTIESDTLPLWYLVILSVITLFLCYWISKVLMKYCPSVIGRT